nr:MAG TPA: hypothetical protein [Caudoviricetes sp.]
MSIEMGMESRCESAGFLFCPADLKNFFEGVLDFLHEQ